MKSRIATLVVSVTFVVAGIMGLTTMPSEASAPSTCCTYANECSGQYDICCPATCQEQGKQCLPCAEAGCKCG